MAKQVSRFMRTQWLFLAWLVVPGVLTWEWVHAKRKALPHRETPAQSPSPSASPGALGAAPLSVPVPQGVRHLRRSESPIRAGEKLHYDVMFWGVPAGKLTVETSESTTVEAKARGRKIQHLKGRFKSSAVLSLFQSIDDRVESWWDYEGLYSHRYDVLMDESAQDRKLTETHDSVTLKSTLEDDWKKKGQERQVRKAESKIPEFPQDLFSSLFYIRALYPSEPGGELKFPLINEGRALEGAVSFLRREKIEVKALGGKIDTVVVVPFTRQDGVRQQKEDSFLWFSTDARRYLVRMEAKTRIGFVVAQLVEIESAGN